MADTLRVGSFRPGGQFVSVLDLTAGAGAYFRERDTLKITPAPPKVRSLDRARPWAGSRPIGVSHDNASITQTFWVKGTSANDAIAQMRALLSQVNSFVEGRLLEWKLFGSSSPVYFDIRGPGTASPNPINMRAFEQAFIWAFEVTFPIGPLALGAPMDVGEDFAPRGNVLYTNLCTNPSGELNVNGWNNNLTGNTTGLAQSALGATRGSNALRVTGSTTAATPQYPGLIGIYIAGDAGRIRVTPGAPYSARIDFLVTTKPASAGVLTFMIRFHDASGASVGDSISSTSSASSGILTTTGVAPTNAEYGYLLCFFTTNASGQAYDMSFDGMLLVQSATLPAYFDGDTDRGNWTGIAHASTSQLYDAGPLDDWTSAVDGSTGAAAMAASSGVLHTLFPAMTNLLYHSGRGYAHSDVQALMQYTTGANTSSIDLGLTVRRQSNGDYLLARVLSNGATTALDIYKYQAVSNTFTQLGTVAASGSLLATKTTFWLRVRIEGPVLTVEHFTAEPTPGATPTATLSVTLSAADAASFVRGFTGVRVSGSNLLDLTVDDVRIEPYTYSRANANGGLADTLRLLGVPGDAPALTTLDVSSAPNVAALFGWRKQPAPHNLVWNGDLETNVAGWAINGTNATLTRTTSVAKLGAASLNVAVTPATQFSGATFKIYRKFRKGVTYTGTFWIRSAADTNQIEAEMSEPGVGDASYIAPFNLSSTWTQKTWTWTPTADHPLAQIAIYTNTVATSTFQIDGVQVYEGTTAPSTGRQAEGAGGIPPFGVIEAEAADPTTLTGGLAITANASSSGGNNLDTGATLTGAGSAQAEWFLDPALLLEDDFADGTIDVEFYGAVLLTGNPMGGRVLTLSARADAPGVNYPPEQFTAEYGSAGKALPDVTSGNVYTQEARVWRRLGTLTFDTKSTGRQRLRLTASWTSATTGRYTIDRLVAVPARANLSSPQGVRGSGLAIYLSTYPAFLAGLGRKRIMPDRSGRIEFVGRGFVPDHGLAGAPLELAPGDNEVLVSLMNEAADPPNIGDVNFPADYATGVTTGLIHFGIQPRYHLSRGAS